MLGVCAVKKKTNLSLSHRISGPLAAVLALALWAASPVAHALEDGWSIAYKKITVPRVLSKKKVSIDTSIDTGMGWVPGEQIISTWSTGDELPTSESGGIHVSTIVNPGYIMLGFGHYGFCWSCDVVIRVNDNSGVSFISINWSAPDEKRDSDQFFELTNDQTATLGAKVMLQLLNKAWKDQSMPGAWVLDEDANLILSHDFEFLKKYEIK